MPRKPKEKEEEIDVQTNQKKETFATRWFKDYAVNNADELRIICNLTARSAWEQFTLRVRTENTEIYAVVFYATFMEILYYLRDKQKSRNNFTIQIANSINIGYTNNSDENNEKVGNFMPIMEFINVNRNVVRDDRGSMRSDSDDKKDPEATTKGFLEWQNNNTKSNVSYYKEIKESAYNVLKRDYHIDLRTSEAILPLFCIFMDNITNVLKEKYREAEGTDVSEVSINVLGLFDAFYSFDEEENTEVIEFTPNIKMKLALKSDDIADRG